MVDKYEHKHKHRKEEEPGEREKTELIKEQTIER